MQMKCPERIHALMVFDEFVQPRLSTGVRRTNKKIIIIKCKCVREARLRERCGVAAKAAGLSGAAQVGLVNYCTKRLWDKWATGQLISLDR